MVSSSAGNDGTSSVFDQRAPRPRQMNGPCKWVHCRPSVGARLRHTPLRLSARSARTPSFLGLRPVGFCGFAYNLPASGRLRGCFRGRMALWLPLALVGRSWVPPTPLPPGRLWACLRGPCGPGNTLCSLFPCTRIISRLYCRGLV